MSGIVLMLADMLFTVSELIWVFNSWKRAKLQKCESKWKIRLELKNLIQRQMSFSILRLKMDKLKKWLNLQGH